MDVREMAVSVGEPLMRMRMDVGLARLYPRRMLMLVVFIVHMPMVVRERLVRMLMLVPFCKMEPHSKGHQHACAEQGKTERLLQKDQ